MSLAPLICSRSEHLFLVEEMVNGVTLESHFAQEDPILAPYLHHGTRIEPFLEAFVPVAIQFVGMLRAIHARGIILGDLSPRNILIDPATGKIGLIDFESAVRVDEIAELGRHALAWATPGFMDEGRLHAAREPTFHDDVFALGRVLLSLVVPVNQFLIIAPGAHTGSSMRWSSAAYPMPCLKRCPLSSWATWVRLKRGWQSSPPH